MTTDFQIVLATPSATLALGQTLGRSLSAGSVILLLGELGSGKTTLVQGLGASLGINDPIVSPTFTIINEYLEGRLPLYHLDLYRLAPPEVMDLHLETYWSGIEVVPGIITIEWAEKLLERPESYLVVKLSYTEQGDRLAHFTAIGDRAVKMLQTVKLDHAQHD